MIIPKVSLNQSINFFKGSKFKFVYDQFLRYKKSSSKFRKFNYLPNLIDLYRLHSIITKNKRIKVLEFGSGISTAIIADALHINKKKYEKKIFKINSNLTNKDHINESLPYLKKNYFKYSNPFDVISFDDNKYYINETKKILKNLKIKNFKLKYSKGVITKFNNHYSFEYDNNEIINADLIYIDGPGVENIFKKKYTTEINPVSSDVLKIEYFLYPGTLIVVDGMPQNVLFLKDNLKRNWTVVENKKLNQTVFYLKEKPLGAINKSQLKFYSSKF
tara:strand:- start:101 stop:925 length:825 start_codon:yes stop_codon:yes gene_type:complete